MTSAATSSDGYFAVAYKRAMIVLRRMGGGAPPGCASRKPRLPLLRRRESDSVGRGASGRDNDQIVPTFSEIDCHFSMQRLGRAKVKKSIFLTVVLTLLLTGCARGRLGDGLNGYTDSLVQTPNPMLPNIFVSKSEGKKAHLIIDQEPIHLKGYQGVTIAWALRAGSEYKFPDAKSLVGLRRDCTGPNLVDERLFCTVRGTDGKTLECTFPERFFAEGVKYCYSLTVLNTITQEPITTDPSIVSD
jgi:hypothetical protein